MAIKTETIICNTYNGVDIIIAREAKDLTQGKLAKLCSWSQAKESNHERPIKFIVIPPGYKAIDQADFDVMQEALS